MSRHAICVSCNPGYGFGLISTMNAMAYYGTDADWEIGYEDFSEDYRKKVSDSFPFEVHWTPIQELMQSVVDKRTDQSTALERFWLGYWLLAHKVLKEKKYKAVAVTQADQFTFVNLNQYFKMAADGKVVSAEFHMNHRSAHTLPFGDDKAIWDRSQCAIFDNLNFLGQKHTELPIDIIHYQEEDAFRGESNHSVISLNRAVCRHCTEKDVVSLAGDCWSGDADWSFRRFEITANGDEIWDTNGRQIKGWHARWWQLGRAHGEWTVHRPHVMSNSCSNEYLDQLDNLEHNMNVMMSENYMKEIITRPRLVHVYNAGHLYPGGCLDSAFRT
jgi:hypothetical protein